MIDIDQALQFVIGKCSALNPERRQTANALGYVLAEDVAADVDSPPHDKSLVDGYAIRLDDADQELRLIETVVAGAVPVKSIVAGATSQVMTGAPIPQGTEAMVMVENAVVDGDRVRLSGDVRRNQCIMPKATTFAMGDVVLTKGKLLRPIEIGLLSEVGRDSVMCHRRPRVAILPTGDELVPCTEKPTAGQIRNSNGPMLAARIEQAGCEVVSLGIGRDDEAELRTQIESGLSADILVVSGGVSAGVLDLVPSTLQSLGVEEVFHKVRLKPGKPLWFGCRQIDGRSTLVFGLPGNPVSSLVCFEVFVKAAIRALSGLDPQINRQPVRLADSFELRGNRPTFHPATLYRDQGRTFAKPLAWHGSADMLSISNADCFVYFPTGDRTYDKGAKLEAIGLGGIDL